MLRLAVALAVMCLAAPAAPAEEGAPAAGQKMELLLGAASRPGASAFEPGEILELRVRMVDLLDGQPVSGLHPSGFVRRAGSSGSTCSEAAQAYRATGRVGLGDIDLSGVTLLVAQGNGMLAAVDPSMSLASANIRWLARLGTEGTPVVRAGLNSILAKTDGWRAVNEADGAVAPLPGLPDGADLVTTGREGAVAYIAPGIAGTGIAGIGVYDVAARKIERWLAVPEPATMAVEGGDLLAVLMSDGRRLAVVDTRTGNVVADHALSGPATALAYSAPADAFLAATGATMTVLHPDAPEILQRVALAGVGTALTVSADQRTAFSHDGRSGLVNVVDLVRQALVQALHFPEGVAGIASTWDNVSILMAARWAVANISTDTLKAGKQPNVTEVALPSTGPEPGGFSGPLILSVGPFGPTLVAQPGTREVYIMPHEPGMRAPTNSIAIRGGDIRSIGILARAFQQTEDGYKATVSVPHAGRYEAVISAGIFGATACLPFVVGTPATDAGPRPGLSLHMPRQAGSRQPVAAEVRMPDAGQAAGPVNLLIISTAGNFQDLRTASVSADGLARFSVRFPHPGLFIVSATVQDGTRQHRRAVDQIEISDP